MTTDINQYLALRTALITEQAQLEARLNEINQALKTSGPAAAPSATPTTPSRMKRVFSAATKHKMAAAQKARWAAKKGVLAKAVAAPEAQSKAAAKPSKRKYSAESKARMAAGAKARWAKVRATKAKVGK